MNTTNLTSTDNRADRRAGMGSGSGSSGKSSDGGICGNDGVIAMLLTLNSISIVFNILHIAVLKNVSSLKGKPYLSALVVISCTDMLHATASLLNYSCGNISDLLPIEKSLWHLLVSVCRHSAATIRFVGAGLISVERCTAVCKPFERYFLLKHLGKLAALVSTVLFGVFLMLRFMGKDGLNGLISPKPQQKTITACTEGIFLGIAWSTLIVSTVTSIQIRVELHRLAKQAAANQDAELNRTSIYIILSNSIFYLLMSPPAIKPFVRFAGSSSKITSKEYTLFLAFAHVMYGIFNIILYWGMFKGYRQQLLKMVRRLFCQSPTSSVDAFDRPSTM